MAGSKCRSKNTNAIFMCLPSMSPKSRGVLDLRLEGLPPIRRAEVLRGAGGPNAGQWTARRGTGAAGTAVFRLQTAGI